MNACILSGRRSLAPGRPAPLLPRRLRPGSVIGVMAPASPFAPDVLERGVRALREMGFEVRFSEDLFDSCGYLAGPDEHRAAAFNRLVADPEIDAIMCARGGYGSLRILPLLDYARVAEHPKAVIGFSDVTALLWALYSRCGLIGFHGPLVTTLADAAPADRSPCGMPSPPRGICACASKPPPSSGRDAPVPRWPAGT